MRWRALSFGFVLGLVVAGFTYFNDAVIRQTPFVGNHLPVAVFGGVLVAALAVNPLLARIRKTWALRPGELALAAAVALAACGWPGSGFYRTFATALAMPADLLRNSAAWQAAGVMSYVPDGSPMLAEGQLRGLTPRDAVQHAGRAKGDATGSAADAGTEGFLGDTSGAAPGGIPGGIPGLASENIPLGERMSGADAPPAARAVWSRLTPRERRAFMALARGGRGGPRGVASQSPGLGGEGARSTGLGGEDAQEPELGDESSQRPRVGETAATTASGNAVGNGFQAASGARDAVLRALNRVLREVGWVESLPAESLPQEAKAWLARRDAQQSVYDVLLEAQGAWVQRHGPDALTVPSAGLDYLRGRAKYLRDDVGRTGEVYRSERMANRWALSAALPGYVAPPPAGTGVLPAGGRADPWVVDGLLVPRPGGAWLGVAQLPWRAWSPVLWRWCGVAAMLGLATLCLSLIVHPQWSQRELLPYTLVRFVHEASACAQGRRLPDVLTQRLFWVGGVSMLALHTVNGLGAWLLGPKTVLIKTTFDFSPFKTLFPHAAEVPATESLFEPTVYPIVIAFTFFLTLSVGFSLGSASFFWAVLGAFLLAGGQEFSQAFYDARQGNLLRFGAYLGMGMMIAYTGRRYYLHVAGAALGMRRGAGAAGGAGVVAGTGSGTGAAPGAPGAVGLLGTDQTPGYAVWAARLLPVFVGLSVWWLSGAGLAWGWALVFVMMCLVIWLVMARIVCETGCFYVQPGLLPVGLLAALVGPEALGPTGLILVGMASMLIVGDQREALMPFLATGLKLADPAGAAQAAPSTDDATAENAPRDAQPPQTGRAGRGRRGGVGRAAWAMAVMLLLSLVVAGVVTFWLQYNVGIDATDRWAKQWFPEMAWNDLSRRTQEMSAAGTLTETTWDSPMHRLGLAAWDAAAWGWLAAGLALVVGCAFARLRLAWWPIHPVLFLVWGTMPGQRFAWSFLLGWMIKALVVKLGGAKGYHAARPLMIGVIAGELCAALAWIGVGVIYYLVTGQKPADYVLLPR